MPAYMVRLCLLLCACVLIAPQKALGHAQLLETVPAANDVLPSSPAEIRLVFNEPVSVLAMQIRDGRGNLVPVGSEVGVEGNNVVLPLPVQLAEGQYYVAFRVLSADAHTISESFGFGVGSERRETSDVMRPAPAASELWPALWSGIARWLFMLALLSSAGFVIFRQLVTVPTSIDDWMLRTIGSTARWGLLAVAAYWVASAVAMAGVAVWSLQGITTVAGTTLGTSLAIAALGLVALALAPGRASRVWTLAGAALLILSRVITGHPASREPEFILQSLMAAHVAAAAFWLAALVVLLRAMRSLSTEAAGAVVADFGRIAIVAVGIVLTVAGITTAILHLATPAAMLTTTYGLLLTAKLVGVLALFALAAYHKLRATSPLVSGDSEVGRRFQTSLRLELIVLLVVIAISTAVASTPPESSAISQRDNATVAPFAVISGTGNYSLSVELSEDESLIRLVMTDMSGQAVEPLEWSASADIRGLDMDDMVLRVEDEVHPYVTIENRVPRGAIVRYTVSVLITDFDLERFEFELSR